MIDSMEEARAELETVIDMITNDEILGKLQDVLEYLNWVEERIP
jgi:hypothetical protein